MSDYVFDDERARSSAQVVYCGPNIPKMALRKYQVFIGQNNILMQAIDKYPEISKLIVPFTELEDMRRKINTPGTPENLYYETVRGKIN